MVKKIEVRVYGTIAGEKRMLRRGHYYSVTRDKYGHFKTTRKWSQKRPNLKAHYEEKDLTAETGREAKEKIVETIEEYDWDEYKVKS